MNVLLNITFLLLSLLAKDEPKFPVSAIPENMKTGMYAVIREHETRFEINSINNSTTYIHFAVTILNGKGKGFASETLNYDKFTSIKSFKGIVYNEKGEVIKKLKQSEIYDQSAYDGSLFSDNRIKHADLSQGSYPYTVEYEYETEQKFLYSIPSFFLYADDEVSIQKETYSLIYPREFKPRYKLFKIDEPKIGAVESKESMSWVFNNIIPEKFETLSPQLSQIVPNIKAGIVDFEYDNYRGKLDSWENYGKWQAQLNNGRNVLPEATKQKIKELIKNVKSNEEKIQLLYQYLQSKTRYVNIALGIGGLQPFDAKTVDQTGYGDCKGLSNYMVAILAEAGIKAYYTKIMAGANVPDIDTKFPSHQTNHIIVAVPNQRDTIWLECTSQTNPFGYLGNFTGNRYGLMVTETGGKLVKTISYSGDVNVQTNIAEVVIESTGNGRAKVNSTYSGLQYENNNLDFVITTQNDDQKKWILENTAIPTFNVNSFLMVNHKNKIPSAEVTIDLSLPRYASVSGKRIFITPNLMNRSTYVPDKIEKRKSEVVRKMGYTDFDTIRYHLPEGIYPEFLPEAAKVKSRFGEYEATFKIDEKGLIYTRRMKMNSGTYPPESYNELIDFYRGVNKADNTKLVFVSKT